MTSPDPPRPRRKVRDQLDAATIESRLSDLDEQLAAQQGHLQLLAHDRRRMLYAAAAPPTVIAALVLMSVPWWVSHGPDDLTSTAAPWTLIAAGLDSTPPGLDVAWLLMAALPMVVYLAAMLAVASALAVASTVRVNVATGLCALAGLVACAQIVAVASVEQSNVTTSAANSDVSVGVTAAGLTTIAVWVIAAIAIDGSGHSAPILRTPLIPPRRPNKVPENS